MKSTKGAVVKTLAIAVSASVIGCAPLSRPATEREQTAAVGGLAGGAGGAIIGSMAGGAVAGGLFGIPLGALAGWYIGDQMERRAQVDEARLEDRNAELDRLRRENERLRSEGDDRSARLSRESGRETRPVPQSTVSEQELASPRQPASDARQESGLVGSTRGQQGMAGARQHAMSPEQVRQAQAKLNDMGYQVGQVDGVWGPMTQSAVRNFQQSRNIEATGQLDEETLKALGVEEGAGRENRDQAIGR